MLWLESRGAWKYVYQANLQECGAFEVSFDKILCHLKQVDGILMRLLFLRKYENNKHTARVKPVVEKAFCR